MAERERKNKLTVYLNDAELEYLEQRCRENNESKSQIIRELIVFGFNYKRCNQEAAEDSSRCHSLGKEVSC